MSLPKTNPPSGVVISITNCYIRFTLLYLLLSTILDPPLLSEVLDTAVKPTWNIRSDEYWPLSLFCSGVSRILTWKGHEFFLIFDDIFDRHSPAFLPGCM